MPELKKAKPVVAKPDLERRAHDQLRFALNDHERANLSLEASLASLDDGVQLLNSTLEEYHKDLADKLSELTKAVVKLAEIMEGRDA